MMIVVNYILLVINFINGCIVVSDVVVLFDFDVLQVFNVLFDLLICQGDIDGSFWVNEVVGGSLFYFYSFNDQFFFVFMNYLGLGVGIYEMVVEDVNGC